MTTMFGSFGNHRQQRKLRFLWVFVGICAVNTVLLGFSLYHRTWTNDETRQSVKKGSSPGVKDEESFVALASTRRLINDVTLPWNETMHRPWLGEEKTETNNLPSTMILMTTYGWNHPNQNIGLTLPRSIRERKLYSALVNHPLFHPTAWQDIKSKSLPIRNNTNYYVFLDLMTCPETNYPVYGGGAEKNWDFEFNRSYYERTSGENLRKGWVACNPLGYKMAESGLFQAAADNYLNINVTLMLFDCSSFGNCKNRKDPDLPTSIVYISGNLQDIDESIDQGLIPPPGNPTVLTLEEEESIRSCQAENQRDFNVVYMGNFRSGRNAEFHKIHGGARESYKKHHNASEHTIVQTNLEPKPIGQLANGTSYTLSYTDVLRRTKFGLAPRGDDKFSYRLTEVLSAGAIPVYHGDNYVLPFRPELFDWDKCAILLPEKDAGEVAMEYIQNKLLPDPETMCAMRNYCYFEIYKKYAETEEGIINGLVKGLNLVAKGHSAKFQGTKCNHTIDSGCNNVRRQH